jgi:Tfp pilus assembly protein PilE
MKFKYGMSMVEIMIGVILLALIVIPSFNVITSKTKAVTSTRDHAQASFVAQKIQETARSYKFDLLEADQYISDTAKQKKTFEWKIKNEDELKKHSLNGIDYLIEDVAIDPVFNSKDPTSQDRPIIQLFKFTVKYIGKDQKEHILTVNTALSKRE